MLDVNILLDIGEHDFIHGVATDEETVNFSVQNLHPGLQTKLLLMSYLPPSHAAPAVPAL